MKTHPRDLLLPKIPKSFPFTDFWEKDSWMAFVLLISFLEVLAWFQPTVLNDSTAHDQEGIRDEAVATNVTIESIWVRTFLICWVAPQILEPLNGKKSGTGSWIFPNQLVLTWRIECDTFENFVTVLTAVTPLLATVLHFPIPERVAMDTPVSWNGRRLSMSTILSPSTLGRECSLLFLTTMDTIVIQRCFPTNTLRALVNQFLCRVFKRGHQWTKTCIFKTLFRYVQKAFM